MRQQQQQGGFNIWQMEEVAIGLLQLFTGIFSRPVDLICRPWHGTRFFQTPVLFFSSVVMLFLPIFSAVGDGIGHMVPFMPHAPVASGFDIGDFAKLYFLLTFIHAFRIYRLMLHPERESHSEFEGKPLFPFYLLPGAIRFFPVRIVFEPAGVFIAATILGNFGIITSGLQMFLHFAAICMAMRAFLDWYAFWLFRRRLLDQQAVAPLLSKMVQNTATDEELAPIHLASFPKDSTPEFRKETAFYIARAYDVRIPETEPQGDRHGND
jgi:hypothetical protein